jgi:hypothetical protein
MSDRLTVLRFVASELRALNGPVEITEDSPISSATSRSGLNLDRKVISNLSRLYRGIEIMSAGDWCDLHSEVSTKRWTVRDIVDRIVEQFAGVAIPA